MELWNFSVSYWILSWSVCVGRFWRRKKILISRTCVKYYVEIRLQLRNSNAFHCVSFSFFWESCFVFVTKALCSKLEFFPVLSDEGRHVARAFSHPLIRSKEKKCCQKQTHFSWAKSVSAVKYFCIFYRPDAWMEIFFCRTFV